MSGLEKFEKLIEDLRSINHLGKKNSEKFLLSLIQDKNKLKDLRNIVNELETNYSSCPVCNFFTVDEICEICSDNSRNKNLICVVPTIIDAMSIEKTKTFNGLYHIICGEISVSKNIGPKDLKIDSLFSRIKNNEEIIVALNATLEGEVTTNYIASIANKLNINITRLATGIPVGGLIDYIDSVTLQSALKNRRKF